MVFLNKVLISLCENYIMFLHSFYSKNEIPFKSMGVLYILGLINISWLTYLFLFIYFLGFLVFLLGICFKPCGNFFAAFLKKHSDEKVFCLLGNGFGSTILGTLKIVGAPTIKKAIIISGKTGVAGGAFLGIEHVANDTFHVKQLVAHGVGDLYNGVKTPLKIDPEKSTSLLKDLLNKAKK